MALSHLRPLRGRTLAVLAAVAVLSGGAAREVIVTAGGGGGPAATWYVSPTGSDGNSGTDSGHPFLTLNKAYQSASCGDVVQLSGTFNSGSVIDSTPRKNCSNGTYVTFQGPATFRDVGGVVGATSALEIATADVHLTNVTLTEQTGSGGYDAVLGVDSPCGTTYAAQNIEVDNVTGTHFVIASAKNVYFHDNTWNYTDDWATGGSHIYPAGGCSAGEYPGDNVGLRISHNTWQQSLPGSNCAANNGGNACHLDCLTIGNTDPNQTAPGDSVWVERNVFDQCSDIDVWFKAIGATGSATDQSGILIENNDMGASVEGAFVSEMNCIDLSSDFVKNSAYRYNSMQEGGTGLRIGDTNCTFQNVKVEGNVMPVGDGCAPGVTVDYNVMETGTCGTHDVTVGAVSALYVDDANMDLHLANGVAAIGAGDPAYLPSLDLDGNARPIGTVDAGAHERS